MLPGPTLMTRPPAAFQFEHVDQTQVAGAAESGKICDSDDRTAGRDESSMYLRWQSFSATYVSPSSVRQCDRHVIIARWSVAAFAYRTRVLAGVLGRLDRKSTRLNSSHRCIS